MAAVSTSIAFVPQILKIRRTSGRDLSYPMLFLYLLGVSLWLACGIMIRARAVVANGLAVGLVSGPIAMKWKYERLPGWKAPIRTSARRVDGSHV